MHDLSYKFQDCLKQNTRLLKIKQITRTLREMCIVVLLHGADHLCLRWTDLKLLCRLIAIVLVLVARKNYQAGDFLM